MAKKRNNIAIGLLSLVILITCQSCEKEENPTGGLNGLWRCEESGLTSPRTYNIDIAATTNDTTVYKFYNFHNIGFDKWVYAVSNGSLLTIESQLINNGTTSVSGSGTIDPRLNIINLEYSINQGYGNIEIVTILTRL